MAAVDALLITLVRNIALDTCHTETGGQTSCLKFWVSESKRKQAKPASFLLKPDRLPVGNPWR